MVKISTIKQRVEKINRNYKQQRLFQFEENKIHLIKCPITDDEFAYYYFTHYPDSYHIVGRFLNYKIYYGNNLIGIIGVVSPPYKYILFNNYFHSENTFLWLNNNVFRILKSEKNRGTKILKLFRERVFIDYYKKYHLFLLGLITFVEPPRNGNLYKADNWDYLGLSQGIQVYWRKGDKHKKRKKTIKKHIYGMKFPKRYKNKILR